jgi:hypothetical protein
MNGKVKGSGFGVETFVDQLAKEGGGVGFGEIERQRLLQIVEIVDRLELGNAGRHHHGKESDEHVSVGAHNVVAAARHVAEALERATLLAAHRVHKLGRQHERRSIAPKRSKHLRVAQKLAKINVKQSSVARNHDIIVVSIANIVWSCV